MKRDICRPGKRCSVLEGFIEGANYETTKGFCEVRTIDGLNQKIKVFGIAYKARKKDKGLILNFCPWCGEKLGISLETEELDG